MDTMVVSSPPIRAPSLAARLPLGLAANSQSDYEHEKGLPMPETPNADQRPRGVQEAVQEEARAADSFAGSGTLRPETAVVFGRACAGSDGGGERRLLRRASG